MGYSLNHDELKSLKAYHAAGAEGACINNSILTLTTFTASRVMPSGIEITIQAPTNYSEPFLFRVEITIRTCFQYLRLAGPKSVREIVSTVIMSGSHPGHSDSNGRYD
jgi:hypothetical protein